MGERIYGSLDMRCELSSDSPTGRHSNCENYGVPAVGYVELV